MRPTKLAGIAGIVWAVTNGVVGFSTGEPPALDDPATDIRAFLGDSRSALLAMAFVFVLTLPALFVFFGELLGRTRDTRSATSALADTASAALGVFAAAYGVAILMVVPLAMDADVRAAVPDGALRYLWAAAIVISLVANAGSGVVLLALAGCPGVVPRRSRIAAAVIGVFTIVFSAIGVIQTDVALLAGLTFALLAIWIVVVAIGMVRHAGATSPAAVGM